MSKQLYKSTAIVGSMTMISRVMGFIRDMLVANLFGVNADTDAFFVAFRIPNLLRRLFAEGAFAHAFVPVLAEYSGQGERSALRGFIDRTFGTLAGLLFLMTLLGTMAAPLLILLVAPGFVADQAHFVPAAEMLRITLPYLFFISLVAFAGAILNAEGRFAVPALTPVILNLVMIAAAVWLAPHLERPITALAWGVFAAGIMQLLFQIPSLWRIGLMPRPRWAYRDPGVQRVVKLMLPAIFGVSVAQINMLVGTLIASFLAAGSVSWLYYSDRLVEFPLGILGVALSTVILPNLSKNHIAADRAAFSAALDWGLKLVVLIGVPATLGLTQLAEPLLSTLFQYHEFGVEDVHMTGRSLAAYALGLLALMLIKILVPGFTARLDTRSPVRFGMSAVAANGVLNLLLVPFLAHAGVALAATLAAYLNAGLLLNALLRNGTYRPRPGWLAFAARIVIASATMSGFLIYFVQPEVWFSWGAGQRGLQLGAAVGGAIAVYAAVLLICGLRPRDLSFSVAPS